LFNKTAPGRAIDVDTCQYKSSAGYSGTLACIHDEKRSFGL
jgi:hypothetical protein